VLGWKRLGTGGSAALGRYVGSPEGTRAELTVSLPRSDWLLIAAGAGLLTLAYPPFQLVVPAFVCLVPASLLILRGCADAQPGRRHLQQGFWYGTLTQAVLLHWLAWALFQREPFAVTLYVAAAMTFGGMSAIMFALVGIVARSSPAAIVVGLSAGVVSVEWLTAEIGPFGFPWHQLALTLADAPVLIQTADLAGSAGLGFLLAALNGLLAMTLWTWRSRAEAFRYLETALALSLVMVVYGLHRLASLPLIQGDEVAVVQPNVAVDEKWVPGYEERIVDRTARLTERALAEARPRLVAWPETALPDVLRFRPDWTPRLAQLANRSGSTLLTGGFDQVESAEGNARPYNAAFAFHADGRAAPSPVYRKRKLVPLVEWIPDGTPGLSRARMGGYARGHSMGVADAIFGRFGILICYELTFPDLAREARLAGAEVLVTLSNDAWFGRTAAPYQHFAHATLRAVENRVTVVRAANTGVSGVVDPLGRVLVRTDPFVETYATARIWRSDVTPLATRLAGPFGPGSLLLLLGMCVASRRRRSR